MNNDLFNKNNNLINHEKTINDSNYLNSENKISSSEIFEEGNKELKNNPNIFENNLEKNLEKTSEKNLEKNSEKNSEKNLDKNLDKNSEKNFSKKIVKMSFEESMARLDKIVEILSSQKNNLEEMIQLYEEATILKEHCDKRLSDAKMKIEHINKKNNDQ
jgi:exodeoxyribonuclease VII small subunit